MKSSLRAYLLSIVVACSVITGCAQDSKVTQADMREQIGTELGSVEKVTVMSTDGQEVSLELPEFLKELQNQGKDLQLSRDPLKQDEVRFTLVLYRKQLAPLVVSVGEKASQFGENTYRGTGAITFYQWVHRLTGKGLLPRNSENILLSADDLSQSRVLEESEKTFIQSVLQKAVPESDHTVNQHPLYPNYKLRINSSDRPIDITILTPTLITIPFGRDQHFYHVDGQMFSTLTEYLLPREKEAPSIEKLFKATKIRVEATGDMRVDNLDLDVTQSTVEQGIAHQAVRLLKTGVQLVDRPQQEIGPEEYRIHFRIGDNDQTVIFYARHFRINDKWYAHNQVQKAIWKLLEHTQK
ncbi:hypothetical protein [Brevibacillus choshinensis]|uniref:Uncharacterized protein n=1 Tax=Brevibacillus choshinensis TaxID=54911 RepID=A0ABX7FJJ7_BRECH|nr:hypothetical protein [Brevibacillus choshinensis]QRG65511.1 hypothetical protein JNE38_18000 [Brevibacillus choshinensis]